MQKYRLYLRLLELGSKTYDYSELSSRLYFSDDKIFKDLLHKMQRNGLITLDTQEIFYHTKISVIPGMVTFSKHGIMQIQNKRVTA